MRASIQTALCRRESIAAGFLLTSLAFAGCGSEPEEETETPCVAASGEICTIAGSGISGLGGDNGPALKADLYLPIDLTIAPDGETIYFPDWNNHMVRKIAKDGTITTVAGTGFLGDGPPGPALESDFNHPTNIIFDAQGRMLIAAWHNSRIKRIDLTTNTLEDLAGTGKRAYSGNDGPAATADLDLPASIAFDSAGSLFVMDQANQVIRKIDNAGMISLYAGQCIINACAMDEVPTACPMTNKLACNVANDPMACGKPCSPGFADGPKDAARLSQPFGQAADPAGRIAFDTQGNLLFADTTNHRVRKIDNATGMITTIAGKGTKGASGVTGPAIDAELNTPTDIAVDSDGSVFIADTQNSCVRKVDPSGMISTVAGVCGERGFAGDDGLATAAKLDRPYGIALDPAGNLYIADTYNQRLRRVAK